MWSALHLLSLLGWRSREYSTLDFHSLLSYPNRESTRQSKPWIGGVLLNYSWLQLLPLSVLATSWGWFHRVPGLGKYGEKQLPWLWNCLHHSAQILLNSGCLFFFQLWKNHIIKDQMAISFLFSLHKAQNNSAVYSALHCFPNCKTAPQLFPCTTVTINYTYLENINLNVKN